jgi:S-formylglutathione hydrolase FrmB
MPVVRHRLASTVLAGNPLGDPTERDLYVYLPPSYDERERYPAVLAIVGYTGSGGYLFNVDTLLEPLDVRLDKMIAAGTCPPVIVAAPDCMTRVGGNQYINSAGTGRYEDYLCDEVIPFVNATYRTQGRWGVFGKSSGGYGSIMLGMRRPDVFAALADHSGDACFELCYIPDFAGAYDAFRAAGGPAAWLRNFWAEPARRASKHMKPLGTIGMAAHYSPNPAAPAAHAHIDWPFDLETGAFQPAIWSRWREYDPVNLVDAHVANLKQLRAIYVDAGTRDEYALHWGARALVAKLRDHDISVRHEEFDDGHMSVQYRYDVSLPFLVEALRS